MTQVKNTITNTCPDYTPSADDAAILAKAKEEWRASGVNDEIIEANVTAISGDPVVEFLGLADRVGDATGGYVTASGSRLLGSMKSVINEGGWVVNGLEPETGYKTRMQWGQMKPCSPRISTQKKKPIKYEAPIGEPTRAIFLENPLEPDFWPSVENDKDVEIFTNEGAKKGGSLISLGYAAIALPGIWNATKKDEYGNHKLIPDLKRFAQRKRKITFVFDSEGVPRKDANIYKAIKTAGKAFQAEGCDVGWVTWDPELGKGIDDVLANHGPEKVHEILGNRRRLKTYEESLYCVQKTVEQHVFENFFGRGRGDWTVLNQGFYRYTDQGYWEHVEDAVIEKMLADYLMKCYREKGEDRVKSYNVATDKAVVNAFKFCRRALSTKVDRKKSRNLRCFINGTLDMESRHFREHRKNDFLTSCIDSVYIPGQPCPATFEKFIVSSFGEENLSLVRAVISMFLDTSAPWGYFLYIVGQSGGGKGTLLRFLQSLFGQDNVRSGNSFSDIGTPEGRHQYLKGTAAYFFPDMGGFVQGVRPFYELVDNGSLSGRALYSSTTYQAQFDIRFAVASADFLAIENSGDGWERRAIVLPVVSGKRKKDITLEKRLGLCRAEVISWALSMPKEERDYLLMHSESASESAAEAKRSAVMTGDSVRQFVDQCLRPTDSGVGASLAQIHDWYCTYAKAFGYSTMGASRLGSRLQSIIPSAYEPRRKLRADEEGYEPNKFKAAQYKVYELPGLFEFTDGGIPVIIKKQVSEGGLDAFNPTSDAEVEHALSTCGNWQEYLHILNRYGEDTVAKVWPNLSDAVRKQIEGYAPPQEPSTEPRSTLTQDEIDWGATMLKEAVQEGNAGALAGFKSLEPEEKRLIWGALSQELRDSVSVLLKGDNQDEIECDRPVEAKEREHETKASRQYPDNPRASSVPQRDPAQPVRTG